MDSDGLLTISEFNNQVAKWAMKIRREARATLASSTRSSGRLSNWLYQFIDKIDRKENPFIGAAYKVAFSFPRYGVFRAYGAGRGWVVRNGVPVRGWRARSLQQKGYTTREVNRHKFYYSRQDGGKPRQPLDWLDQHIQRAAPELADIASGFYADRALADILQAISKAAIKK